MKCINCQYEHQEKFCTNCSGYYAFGVYAGAKFRIDPNKFIVQDGKYFLYLNNLELDAKQLWMNENNHDALVKKANENWNKLKATYN